MPATLFPNAYSDFVSDLGGSFTQVHFIPVINTSTVAPTTIAITDTEDGGFDLSDVGTDGLGGEQNIINWLKSMETGNQFGPIMVDAVEVNYKEPNGILTSVLAAAKVNQRTGKAMTVGIFNPVGEFFPPDNSNTNQTPEFFRSSNGTCCDTLNVYLYNNPNGTGPIDSSQPVDHSDQRTNLSFINSNGFQYIITDDPLAERNLLAASGKRNICSMQPNPLSNCASGGNDPQLQLLAPTLTLSPTWNSVPPPTQSGVAPPTGYTVYEVLQGTNGMFSCSNSGFTAAELSALNGLPTSSSPAESNGINTLQFALVANYAAGSLNTPFSDASVLLTNHNPPAVTPTAAVSSSNCIALPDQH
jgi:hypothetical protein